MNELLLEIKKAISNASQLCSNMQNSVTYANNITKEAEEKLKVVDEATAKLDIAAKLIKEREHKVSGIEDILAREATAKEIEKKNATDSIKLEHFKTAFNDESAKTLKEIAAKSAKLADDNLLLDKSWKDLRTKEKSYKAEIEADILKRFKK